jgi:hypothetical protein
MKEKLSVPEARTPLSTSPRTVEPIQPILAESESLSSSDVRVSPRPQDFAPPKVLPLILSDHAVCPLDFITQITKLKEFAKEQRSFVFGPKGLDCTENVPLY